MTQAPLHTLDAIVARADAVRGYMYLNELRWLAETARSLAAPAAWCEIGCWQGRSATAVAGGLPPGSRLLLVDNFSGPTTREMPNAKACRRRIEAEIARMQTWRPDLSIRLHIGHSPAVAAPLPDHSLDVVFVDGDHAYAAVLADLRAWWPKLKPGGLFCGHDFTNKCGVEPAVRELLPHYGQLADSSIWFARVP